MVQLSSRKRKRLRTLGLVGLVGHIVYGGATMLIGADALWPRWAADGGLGATIFVTWMMVGWIFWASVTACEAVVGMWIVLGILILVLGMVAI